MKTLQYTRPNDLSQLHDEILAAIPALRPANGAAVMRVEGLGDAIALAVPDAQDPTPVTAVVSAHVPVARPPAPRVTILAAIQAAATVADVKAALVAYFQKAG